jgi:hypothetical protein
VEERTSASGRAGFLLLISDHMRVVNLIIPAPFGFVEWVEALQ